MKFNTILLSTTLMSTFILSGCETQQSLMVKEGYPLSYAQGFDDGCHSGKKAGGNMFEHFKKDTRRFGNDGQYSQGWSDGYRQCETEQESLQRQIRMNLEQQNYYNQRKHNDWQEHNHINNQDFGDVNLSQEQINNLNHLK